MITTDFTSFPLAALVVSHNIVAEALGRPAVKKFSDKDTAARRVAAVIADALEAGLVVQYHVNGAVHSVTGAIVDETTTNPTSAEVKVVEDAQRGELGTGWDHEDGQRLLAKTEDLVIKTTSEPAPAVAAKSASTLDLDLKIEVLVENPKRTGSRAHAVFSLYKTGQTGEEFVQAVVGAGYNTRVALSNLHWDLDHGFVNLA